MDKFDEVVILLAEDKGHWQKTAKITGLKRDWIVKVANGTIKNPGFRAIETLHAHLSRKYPDALKAVV